MLFGPYFAALWSKFEKSDDQTLIVIISQLWSISRVTDLSQREYGDILKTQSAMIKILTFLKCSKNFEYFQVIKNTFGSWKQNLVYF